MVPDMKVWMAFFCVFSLACASQTIPVATESIDSKTLDEEWSIHIVTIDPDGDERVTRIWIALAAGDPTIRTNGSRWWRNLERDSTIRVRLAGTDHPFQVESVTDREVRARIDEAFLEKYGGWERMFFPQDRGQTHDHYARLRP